MVAWADRIAVSGSGCWLWTGAANNGYGRIYVEGRLLYAHRVVYEATVGPIAEGYTLDHLCRITLCVNPAHLEPVTIGENVRRGIKGVLTTACPQGHPYDDINTRVRANGHRVCRTCHRERERARQRAA
jgi:hypothetical protein